MNVLDYAEKMRLALHCAFPAELSELSGRG